MNISLKEHLTRIGSIKSKAKAIASRKNGKKGGRPKSALNKVKNAKINVD